MQRRTLLKVVALGALAARLDATSPAAGFPDEGAAWTAADYRPAFFTAEEITQLDNIMEMIIPADQHSGGARAARVSYFADRMVSTGSEVGKTEWREGLRLLRQEAANSTPAAVLARAAAGETRPQTDLERFFVTLKQMTVNGYYSSEVGIHQELDYQGNTYVAEFPGCTQDLPEGAK